MAQNRDDFRSQMSTRELDARAQALIREGFVLHGQSRLQAARACYEQALQAQPDNARAWYLLGILALQTREPARALECFAKSLELDPRDAASHGGMARAQLQLGRYESALAACDQAIGLVAGNAEFHISRGNALYQLGRHVEALASYDASIALSPESAPGHRNRATTLCTLHRWEEAIASYDRAIAIDPRNARTHNHRGNALYDMGEFEAALASYGAAIALDPGCADAHGNQGNALLALEQFAPALASYDRAIALQPDHAEAHNNRGTALHRLGRIEAALSSFERALALCSNAAQIHFNRAQMLDELRQYAAAAESYDRALALDPMFKDALGHRLLARMQICEWRGFEADLTELAARIGRGEPAATPFCVLALTGSPPLQQRAAQIYMREPPPAPRLPEISPRRGAGRIRLGYFSADFCNHPVSYLTAGLYESHDRSRFELTAFSLGPNTGDSMRRRLEGAFDRFIDLHGRSALEVATLARRLQVDIAVDLTGLTRGGKPKIFSLRAAPVQVSYIGYLGTMGAPCMDYLIADATTVPSSQRSHYSEKLVYLPSYQANDPRRAVAGRTLARHELGLPCAGFVFCCFNASYKITPPIFDAWMRILDRAPDAVLHLLAETETAAENLRREALARGVDARRLVFGAKMAASEHLARLAAADLFLDTLPYNAGATASDALWAGLPLLTCMGETFAGRMAASLLQAARLPELITSTLADYEELAVALARDPQRMAQIRRKLAQHRLTTPLFDTRVHTRSLEAAYTRMQARQDAGLAPADLYIEAPDPARAGPGPPPT
ncbi:MAG TPA: tetratricopeptide repeat protein [Steroidobacteraceae bacterium]|nr:tetratricopeptide repeat protein [Steroidobacteraceae bacterium]